MAEEIKNTPEFKVRYSDEELQEFKAIILEMLEKAKKEYKTLRDIITHDSSNDMPFLLCVTSRKASSSDKGSIKSV